MVSRGNRRQSSPNENIPPESPIAASPSPPALGGAASACTFRVSGSEQVLVDPHNRDAICQQRRGEPMPEAAELCTAYIVDVSRGVDGLAYSVPVRFSRFERLHAELAAELPHLRSRMPRLPSKRGPLDLGKLMSAINRTSGVPAAAAAVAATATAAARSAHAPSARL